MKWYADAWGEYQTRVVEWTFATLEQAYEFAYNLKIELPVKSTVTVGKTDYYFEGKIV